MGDEPALVMSWLRPGRRGLAWANAWEALFAGATEPPAVQTA